jgi:flagellar hook-associated protein FlgK
MDENEMYQTLTEVARMKVQFDLLKQAIKKNLKLNYDCNGLRIEDDRLILELMEMIEPDEMEKIFQRLLNEKKAKERARQEKLKEVAMTKEDDNG